MRNSVLLNLVLSLACSLIVLVPVKTISAIFSNASGQYRFESNFPPGYSGRPPHIHIQVSANGFRTLATQHYPEAGHEAGEFNLVLVPIN